MAKADDMPDLPDLEQFRQRIEAAADAAEEFTSAIGQATPQPQEQDAPLLRDILNALHLIHDEAVSIRNLIENMTQ